MRFPSRFLFLCVFLFTVLILSPVQAAGKTEVLGKFGFWTAYVMKENNQSVCYMSIMARSPQPQKSKRGDVVLMITHRPAENNTDVVSYTAGLKFKPASDVTITAGQKQYNLFTQDDTAWSRDSATDHALSAALRRAASATVEGFSANGTKITDAVNLKGATDAYNAISKACGLPFEEKPKAKTAPKAAAKPAATAPAKKKAK